MTRKTTRRIIVLLALSFVTTMVLAGCKTETKEGTSELTTKPTEVATEASAEPKEDELAPLEPITLSCWATLTATHAEVISSWSENAAFQKACEVNSVTIEWQLPPQDQVKEQFNLMIVSGDLPDMIEFGDYNLRSDYPGGATAAVNDNIIIPLDEYLSAMPIYAAYLAAHEDINKMVRTDDGVLVSMEGILTRTTPGENYQSATERDPEYECWSGLVINEDWLNDLSLDVPVTIDDWTEMLTAFKTEKSAIAPFTTSGGWLFSGTNAFLSAYDTCHYIYEDVNHKACYGPVEDGYLEFLTLMNGWYMNGLMDPDYLTIDTTAMVARVINQESGAYTGYGSRIGLVYRDTREDYPDCNPVAVPNPVLTEGQALLYNQRDFPTGFSSLCITPQCEEIERALGFWDYFWTDEGNFIANWGPEEGVTYIFDENGNPQLGPAITNDPDGFPSTTVWHKYLIQSGPFPVALDNRVAGKMVYGTMNAVTCDALWSQNNGALPSTLPPVTLTNEESTAYATPYNDIKTYTDEMRNRFIMGVEPLENYESFVQALWDMGLQEVLDIQQAAIDRYNNR